MKLTYSVQVCNESRELFSLLHFLTKVIDDEDVIHVVVDTVRKTEKVQAVLEHFKDTIVVFERPFDTFYKNGTFHIENAVGDYVFGLDADEMPQELLIKNIKKIIEESGADIIGIPRINIHPGSTETFLRQSNFHVNDVGWINWPDFQMRVFRACDYIRLTDEVHTKLTGSDKIVTLQPNPKVALWHIKSVDKQESRWDATGGFTTPEGSVYDLLM
jgi:hypothetical protein